MQQDTTLRGALEEIFELSGADLGKPYVVEYQACRQASGQMLIFGARIRDSQTTDWGGSAAAVGSQVLDELHAISVPEDKFVAVSMVVGLGPDGSHLVDRVRVDQMPRPDNPGPSAPSSHPTVHDLLTLWRGVVAYRDKHQITCPETVYQTDRIAVTATEFIADCLEVVGYGRLDDDSYEYVGGMETRVPEGQA